MPKSIRPIRVNHINVVVEDFDASLAHLRKLYGAEFLEDFARPEWHACLVDVGRVIFELFAPHAFLLNARYGPHYLGIEYQADMDDVREVVAAHGLRIARDLGVALHTHPADSFGISFEFWSGYFHDNNWAELGGKKMKPASHWRDEHPLGMTGLKGYTVAVHDMNAATKFLQSFLGGEMAYEAPRPAAAARAVGFQAGDAVIELMTPVKDGPLQRHLLKCGEGIRSTVFGVRNLDQARHHFATHGIELTAGAAPDTLAVPAEANLGMIFEFAE